jgi:hypothetical protein
MLALERPAALEANLKANKIVGCMWMTAEACGQFQPENRNISRKNGG